MLGPDLWAIASEAEVQGEEGQVETARALSGVYRDKDRRGLLPRSMQYLFHTLHKSLGTVNLVRASPVLLSSVRSPALP